MEWDDEGFDDPLGDGFDDGLDGDLDRPPMPLLPPDDRLWRHPSELVAPARPPRSHTDLRLVTVVALTSCLTALVTIGVVTAVRPARTKVAVERVATAPATPATAVTGMADVSPLADGLRAAVVQVLSDGPKGTMRGSGVIYRSDGLLLTAEHVVDQARSLRVLLDDGRSLPARVVGTDTETDIALLDLDGSGFQTAMLGSTALLKVGQPTVTIGAPGAGGPVVSVAVVSALGQSVDILGVHLIDMVQTDAPVAPGCSGAAVVDTAGAVIGIAAGNATTEGTLVGYITPIDVVRMVATQLLEAGHVDRGWLGIEADTLSPDAAGDLGVKGGVLVGSVDSGGPALTAGLAANDIVVAVDGAPVRSMTELIVAVRARRPGETVTLDVVRGGQHRSVRVRLGTRPDGSS